MSWLAIMVVGAFGAIPQRVDYWKSYETTPPKWTWRTLNRVAVVLAVILTTSIFLYA